MKSLTRLGVLAATTAGTVLYARFVRRWQLTWGATPEEVSRALPGDDLVDGQYRTTHVIAIDRPPADVWPWLVQMTTTRRVVQL